MAARVYIAAKNACTSKKRKADFDPASGASMSASMSALESLPDRATLAADLLDSSWLSGDIALVLRNEPSAPTPRVLFRMYFAALPEVEKTLARKKAFTSAKMCVSMLHPNGSKVLVLKPSVEAAVALAQQKVAEMSEDESAAALVEDCMKTIGEAAGALPVVGDSDVDEDEDVPRAE